MKLFKRFGAIGLATVMLMTGCGETEVVKTIKVRETLEAKPQTIEVTRRNIEVATYYDAQVFYELEQLSFPTEGNFDNYTVNLGDNVKEGQVLATSKTTVSDKQIESLQSRVDSLKKNYEYNSLIKDLELQKLELELEVIYDELEKLKYPSDKYTAKCVEAGRKYRQIETKKLEIQQMQEDYDYEYPYYYDQLKTAKDSAGKNIIKAPFDGIVVAVEDIQSGYYVDPESFYIAVANPDVLCVSCDFMSAEFLASYKEVYILINGKKHSVEYVPVDENLYSLLKARDAEIHSTFIITDSDGSVKPGDYATLVTVRKSAENVLSIPAEIIMNEGGKRFVYVEGKDGKEKRYIETGITNGAYTEIVSGLSDGEVVYAGN